MMADVFVARVAQQVELGLIDAHDVSVRTNPMQTDGGIFKKVCQLNFTASQSIFVLFARGNVTLNSDITNRLSLSVLHREGRQLDLSSFAIFCATSDLAP